MQSAPTSRPCESRAPYAAASRSGNVLEAFITSWRPVVMGPCSRAQLRTRQGRRALMIIPRHADLAGDVVIAGGELHAGAGGLLADGRTIQLLPRRLVGRVREATFGLEVGAALLQLVVRDQDVGAAFVEIDANLVAGLQDRKPAIGGGLRRRVEDRWRAGRAGLAGGA